MARSKSRRKSKSGLKKVVSSPLQDRKIRMVKTPFVMRIITEINTSSSSVEKEKKILSRPKYPVSFVRFRRVKKQNKKLVFKTQVVERTRQKKKKREYPPACPTPGEASAVLRQPNARQKRVTRTPLSQFVACR